MINTRDFMRDFAFKEKYGFKSEEEEARMRKNKAALERMEVDKIDVDIYPGSPYNQGARIVSSYRTFGIYIPEDLHFSFNKEDIVGMFSKDVYQRMNIEKLPLEAYSSILHFLISIKGQTYKEYSFKNWTGWVVAAAMSKIATQDERVDFEEKRFHPEDGTEDPFMYCDWNRWDFSIEF